MSYNSNRIFFTGNLTKDPEFRHTPGGAPVTNFTVANNLPIPNKEDKVSYFSVVCWGKTAESCAKYLKRGHKVAVDGQIEQSHFKDGEGNSRSTYQVIAEKVEFLTPKEP